MHQIKISSIFPSKEHDHFICNADIYENLLTLYHLQFHNTSDDHKANKPKDHPTGCIAHRKKPLEVADSIDKEDMYCTPNPKDSDDENNARKG